MRWQLCYVPVYSVTTLHSEFSVLCVPVGEVACEAMLYVHLVYFGAKLRHKEKARNCMVWSWYGPTTCKIDFTLGFCME
jgi:hypothetical protein